MTPRPGFYTFTARPCHPYNFAAMSWLLQSSFEAALRHHQAGDLAQAASGYEAALRINPAFAPAQHYLGLVRYQTGKPEEGISLIRRALALQPDLTEAHYNLGNIYRELGRGDEAAASYRTVLRAEPGNPGALGNLALLLKELGRTGEAEPLLRRLVKAAPGYADGHAALGAVLLETDRPDEALQHLRRAVDLTPGHAEAHYNLGRALFASGQTRPAEESFRTALQLNPRDAEAADALAHTLTTQQRNAEAAAIYRQLAQQYPDDVARQRSLGGALHRAGQLTAAIEIYRQALARGPGDSGTLTNLGSALRDQGRIDEAIDAYRQALKIDPGSTLARSSLLFTLSFKEDADTAEVAAEHRRFDEQHARPLTTAARPHANPRDPERRLRVGYLSADFRNHPGGIFQLPVLEHHDSSQIESYCFSVGRVSDSFTERFRRAAHHWRDVGALTDEGLAEAIRADGIDILVESFGHMAGNRLLAVARKPAPIQIAFPIYPNTSGLTAIDYRLMDPWVAPPSAEALFSETLFRLPETHLCYEPMDRQAPPALDLPMAKNGFITFGCFNNLAKIGPRTVALWARLLKELPSSRLVLKWLGMSDEGDASIAAAFASQGIDKSRLTLLGWSADPYEPYRGIDLCLDPVRAGGGTTTCDSLWMGVPVLTLYDSKPLSRMGLSLLSNVGLNELITADDDAYVRRAMELATQPGRLTAIRQGLRERFMASPVMDGARYTRFVEQAYREMWRRWCRGKE